LAMAPRFGPEPGRGRVAVVQICTGARWQSLLGMRRIRVADGAPWPTVGDSLAVDLNEAVRRRRMVRSFSPEGVDRGVVDRLLEAALRSPTAGNTGGTAWVVLEGPDETSVYWDATTDEAWRDRNRTRFAGLSGAPVVLLSYASPETYADRYAEPDKSDPGLAAGEWPVPYWFGDAAFAVMTVLLGAVDVGLSACMLGNFRGEAELATRLGVPEGWRLFCAVLLGHPDGRDHRSASLDRTGPGKAERIHRARW
jgi:nitroreductase